MWPDMRSAAFCSTSLIPHHVCHAPKSHFLASCLNKQWRGLFRHVAMLHYRRGLPEHQYSVAQSVLLSKDRHLQERPSFFAQCIG